MATIVKMPAPHDRRPRPMERENGATILFFTGVRYMRDPEPEADEAESIPKLACRVQPVDDPGALAFV